MAHFLAFISPDVYRAFSYSDRTILGFRPRQRDRQIAKAVRPGDRLIGYMTRFDRWFGSFEVGSSAFEDDEPIFRVVNDPFILRFRVDVRAWLEPKQAIPLAEDRVWGSLSFTRELPPGDSRWSAPFSTRSLNAVSPMDGAFLYDALTSQAADPTPYELSALDWRRLFFHGNHHGAGADF